MTRGVKNTSLCGHGSGRYEGLCRKCYDKKRYAEKPEARKAQAKAWVKKNSQRRKARNTRMRAHDREVTRALRLKATYNLTTEEYDALAASQNNCCAICSRPASESRHGRLHVDHDHQTRLVRGLLCDSCNLGLGKFGDNADLLSAAATYLRKAMDATPLRFSSPSAI